MAVVNPYIPIITLNVNALNPPGQWLDEKQNKKPLINIHCLRRLISALKKQRLKAKG